MKQIKSHISPIIFLGFLVLSSTSCDNNDDKNNADDKANTTVVVEEKAPTVAVKLAGQGERKEVVVANVPAPLVAKVTPRVKTAKDVKWVAYEPVEADKWDTAKDYYIVMYTYKNVPYEDWYYGDGELIKSEEKISLPNSGVLPKEVVKAIMENYPGYEIVEVDKENDKDMDMYEVEMKQGEKKAKVKFLPNGNIFKAK